MPRADLQRRIQEGVPAGSATPQLHDWHNPPGLQTSSAKVSFGGTWELREDEAGSHHNYAKG